MAVAGTVGGEAAAVDDTDHFTVLANGDGTDTAEAGTAEYF